MYGLHTNGSNRLTIRVSNGNLRTVALTVYLTAAAKLSEGKGVNYCIAVLLKKQGVERQSRGPAPQRARQYPVLANLTRPAPPVLIALGCAGLGCAGLGERV